MTPPIRNIENRIAIIEKSQDKILVEIKSLREEAKADNKAVWTTIHGQMVSLEKLKSLLTGIKAMLALALSSGALIYLAELLNK